MRKLSIVLLLVLAAHEARSEPAEQLLEEYEKSDVVELLLKKCYGEVTINQPFPRRVYGRPPAQQIDARTLAHDMTRCKFTAEDAHAFFERRGALRRRQDPARMVGGSSATSRTASSRSSASTRSSSRSSASTSLTARARQLERKQRERDRAEARRKREGEMELERARQAEMSEDERRAEQRERECQRARHMRDQYRDAATSASTVKMREDFRRAADKLQEAVRDNCKSIL